MEGTPQYTTYTQLGAAGLAIEAEGIIGWAIKTIAKFLFGRIKKRLRPEPDKGGGNAKESPEDLGNPQSQPKDEPQNPFQRNEGEAAETSWLGVNIVVLVKKKLDGLKGVVVGKAINLASGPMTRSIQSVTGGRAEIEIISQRMNPNRYARISRAAGIDPDPAEVLILIPKFVKGLVKGLVAKKIINAVSDRLPNVKVDVIFERTNGKEFYAIESAIDSQETTPQSGDPTKPKDQKKSSLDSFTNNSVKDEQETWLQWAMASLLTLLSAGNIWDRFKSRK